MEPLQTWWTTELYPTSDEDNFGVVGNFEVVKAADAQATIAALQAQQEKLFQYQCPKAQPSCLMCGQVEEFAIKHLELGAIGICVTCVKQRDQLTQRTAELEAANNGFAQVRKKTIERVARHGPIMGSRGEYRQGQLDVLESVRRIVQEELYGSHQITG